MLDGAIYGLASHGRFIGAFKPANRSPDVERLYLAGGAAHPGPGMPMVLMSGWIAADYARSRTASWNRLAAVWPCRFNREAGPNPLIRCWQQTWAHGHRW